MEKVMQLKQQLVNEGKIGLGVDIDETLSWTVKYWMEQLVLKFGNPSGLTVEQLIAKHRYTQGVPFWQTPEALSWMDEQVENDALHEELPLIEGADGAVREINSLIPVVIYPTVRPEKVINGTKVWLDKHNFPEAPILARPPHILRTDGNAWKARALEALYPQVQGIVDDNPGLTQALSADYKGVVYLYDNDESPRTDINVIPCKSWADVVKNVKLHFGH